MRNLITLFIFAFIAVAAAAQETIANPGDSVSSESPPSQGMSASDFHALYCDSSLPGLAETFASNSEIQKDVAKTQILWIGEAHANSAIQSVEPWITNVINSTPIDCLFLEPPSNLMTDDNLQFQGPIEKHPVFRSSLKTNNANSNEHIDYFRALVSTANGKGAKIFHVDLPLAEQNNPKYTHDENLERRNVAIAANIRKLFDKGLCHKAVGEIGLAHLTSNLFADGKFTVKRVPSIPSQSTLRGINQMSVAIANSLLDYNQATADFCLTGNSAKFLRTDKAKFKNLPYNSVAGFIKDFTYILVP
jgi:hypothetical protein